ncbi:SDR family oxidoreductase [Paludibacterium purpuratum]|uniref:NADP-dependent 3-hydroxy acid dehydrogenase YdfG n=1 Tax=Paludibacterium purpuratum TaxID=1144873 RepID=A0A4R7B877_9NEIS|nr:SDR family oxidoreductase [Paludibacterium purpuratum]TDR80072.1 NADP-dependent 3-hydroxy acid dehydrogenase YdfG [Paludibacterium purpuratum]
MSARVAIISGSSRGIGAGLAHMLLANGFKCFGLSRTPNEDLISHDNYTQVMCDVQIPAQIESAVKQIASSVSTFDCLVLNAGIGEWFGATSTPLADWQAMVNTNMSANAILVTEVFKNLSPSENARLFAISSDAADNAYPNRAAYCASKAGFSMYVKCLREELRSAFIGVTELRLSRVNTTFRNKNLGSRPGSLEVADVSMVVEKLLSLPSYIEVRTLEISSIHSTYGQ